MKKLLKIIIVLAIGFVIFSIFFNRKPVEEDPYTPVKPTTDIEKSEKEWSIYWYMCGSDLESNGGYATMDLVEATKAQLSDDVQIIIQTGGATRWRNDSIDGSVIQRWLLTKDTFELVDEVKRASMGRSETLAGFLDFCNTYYPAEKRALTFWNHGGGSVTGVSFDEVYQYDSLTLTEISSALSSVFKADMKNPPLDLVGFDTCLMATIDTASVFKGYASYMVASEEVEPGNGWDYTAWINALTKNPQIDARQLGIAICDTYYQSCVKTRTNSKATLSLTDLSKLDPLLEAYEEFGKEALVAVTSNTNFLAKLGRLANQTENYGGNTRDQGYTNMMDLGHLARLCRNELKTAQSVIDALDDCIVYKVNGPYREESSGLSCYYSYNKDANNLKGYHQQGTGEAFKYLFDYAVYGRMDQEGLNYLKKLNVNETQELPSITNKGWQNIAPIIDDEGCAHIILGKDANELLESVSFMLFYVNAEDSTMLYLGSDDDFDANWEKGEFVDNFRGVWGSIDNFPVYMELAYQSRAYNLYSVPVLVDDTECSMQVVYDFNKEEWTILGVSIGIDENGMASKNVYPLEDGYKITVLWNMSLPQNNGEMQLVKAHEFIYQEGKTVFEEAPLPNGQYLMTFVMKDTMGNTATSQIITFDIKDDGIYTGLLDN